MTKTMIEQEIENEEVSAKTRRTIHYNLNSLRKRRETLLDVLEE